MTIYVPIDRAPKRVTPSDVIRFALSQLRAEARRAEREYAQAVEASVKAWSTYHPQTAFSEARIAYRWFRVMAAAYASIKKHESYLAKVEAARDLS